MATPITQSTPEGDLAASTTPTTLSTTSFAFPPPWPCNIGNRAGPQHPRAPGPHPQQPQPERHPVPCQAHLSRLQKHDSHFALNRRHPSHDQAARALALRDPQDPLLSNHHCQPQPPRRSTAIPRLPSPRSRTALVFSKLSQTEMKRAMWWLKVLGNDDFFMLGGGSLLELELDGSVVTVVGLL